jgi:hypothetical protein
VTVHGPSRRHPYRDRQGQRETFRRPTRVSPAPTQYPPPGREARMGRSKNTERNDGSEWRIAVAILQLTTVVVRLVEAIWPGSDSWPHL